ncbi:hypothetical protein QSJ18_16800 [Gordonia sp. ABSL1-1]|uniref:hypothetical protein n=1 Tax=Gordonia sp. ABSL1-1 TaxID=3053923 RepID=UPI002573EF06|nr:hypothetical protein [Gordonia sp. ABSL1-1]MDL9938412.1 hypothetical protein [Gordonia sp. ABSL1-1]
MSSSHTKTQRKCPRCGVNLHLRRDVVATSDDGAERIDVMLVCPDEGCTQPAQHLRTEHHQPA